MSTIPAQQARGMVWRLNAEATPENKFDHAEMVRRVDDFRHSGYATGDSGFIPGVKMSAVLLPREFDDRPLGLGILYPAETAYEADALVETLKHGIQQVLYGDASELGNSGQFLRAV